MMILIFCLSWVSIIAAIISIYPGIVQHKLKLPESYSQFLLIAFTFFLLTFTWGVYVGGFEYSCNWPTINDFLRSDYCLTQTFFFGFFTLYTECWFFWYSLRIFLHAYQHSNVWDKYGLPQDLSGIPSLVIHLVNFFFSFSIPFTIVIYASERPEELVVTPSMLFQCAPAPDGLALYLFWVPVLVVGSIASIFLVLILGRLWCIGVVVPKRYVISLILYAVSIELAAILSINNKNFLDDAPNNIQDYQICVATKPRQADFVGEFCSLETVRGAAGLLIVNFVISLFPITYCCTAYFSKKQFWEEYPLHWALRKRRNTELQLPNSLKTPDTIPDSRTAD